MLWSLPKEPVDDLEERTVLMIGEVVGIHREHIPRHHSLPGPQEVLLKVLQDLEGGARMEAMPVPVTDPVQISPVQDLGIAPQDDGEDLIPLFRGYPMERLQLCRPEIGLQDQILPKLSKFPEEECHQRPGGTGELQVLFPVPKADGVTQDFFDGVLIKYVRIISPGELIGEGRSPRGQIPCDQKQFLHDVFRYHVICGYATIPAV